MNSEQPKAAKVTKVTGEPWPKRWMRRFLDNLAQCGIVTAACRAAKVSRQHAYRVRETFPEFNAAWEDACEQGIDVLEDFAFKRATVGVEEPVFFNGKVCGHVRKYSDTLLAFLLKQRRYREEKTEISGVDGGPIKQENVNRANVVQRLQDNLTIEELLKLRELTRKAKGCSPQTPQQRPAPSSEELAGSAK